MTYIQNQKLKNPGKVHKRRRRIFISSIVLLVLFVLAVGIYFLILPGRLDSHYLKTIRPLYNQQHAQMESVYTSFSNPVFNAHNLTSATEAQDLASVQTVIQNATAATNTLAAGNSFTQLPGTEHFSAVSQTTKRYNAMQQYVNDSKTFLAGYQADITYIIQFRQIENSSQLPAFFAAMTTLDHATTAVQLLAAAHTASVDVNSITKSLHRLNAPIDFQQTNANLAATVNDTNNAFVDIITGIEGETAEQVANSISSFNAAARPLQGFTATNISGQLGVHSEVYQELLKLKTENPLH
jgi:flagellar basal body-associated protein FliL